MSLAVRDMNGHGKVLPEFRLVIGGRGVGALYPGVGRLLFIWKDLIV